MTDIPRHAFKIRPKTKEDENFIFSTWLRCYKTQSYFAKRIRNHIFFKRHAEIVTHILAKTTSRTFVAHPASDEDTILGYLTCEPGDAPTAHFIYVKEAFRSMGIASALFDAAEIDPTTMTFSHWTFPVVDDFMQRYETANYDPYAI